MPNKQIFFDPQRKRWKRLRRILDVTAVLVTLVLAALSSMSCAISICPSCCCPRPSIITKPSTTAPRCCTAPKPGLPRRKTGRKPSDIPFNTGEGLRAAYYVQDDAASYSSFKEHVHQLDLLFPQWLHVDAPEPTLLAINNDNHREYPVVDGATVHDPDDGNRVKHVIQAAKEDTEIFPHLNNYNPNTQSWDPAVGAVLADPSKRAELRQSVYSFFHRVPGLSRPLAGL